ncbi:uncharacterized protein LY89DRAFT_737539 [Mollisia scopiformis]|uniref:Zn(2)-C6 fungal-type domain-containing protein n=1 Tax=Mollisia scopiformis TaxID=149040 RepID=A0A194X038_MOLSC|nr:uncharacterized protein LY89DRAFT_737539 [Mollisia scopiformis]KUJ13563.1 hypothetical protein LY89DRAFT_737539 [Mollisia scopiformis]
MDKNTQQRPGPARKRASTPRSKTGCTTCKIRRLKCGEERPSCQRCVRSGWQCDGYDHVAPTSPSPEGTIASLLPRNSSISPTPNSLVIEPSVLHPLNEQEQQYFRNCGEEVTGQLQGEDMLFWRGVALQESLGSFSVHHGLIAIGALKQSTVMRTGRYQMDAVPGTHREFALQHYHTAIQSLRESMTNMRDEKEVRSTVVACMILAIFDDFIGHRAFALQHMRCARDILLNSNSLLSASNALGGSDDAKLANMFLRLDVQAMCAIGVSEYQTMIPLQTLPQIFALPTRISSFEEAQNLSTVVAWEGWRFFYHNATYQLLPRHQIPQNILDLRDNLVKQLYDLCLLLADLKECEPGTIRHPLACIKALSLHPVLALVRLASTFGAPETACDALLDQFTYLVSLSKEIIQFEALENPELMEQSSSWTPFPQQNELHPSLPMPYPDLTRIPVAETYSAELRTVSPLLLVATKCRNATLRREAIALLLSSHRREWMCDSLLSGQIGQWMMSLEEEGMDATGYIPEHARAWGEAVELEIQGRKAKVRCRQNFKSRVTGKTEWRWREKHICW